MWEGGIRGASGVVPDVAVDVRWGGCWLAVASEEEVTVGSASAIATSSLALLPPMGGRGVEGCGSRCNSSKRGRFSSDPVDSLSPPSVLRSVLSFFLSSC